MKILQVVPYFPPAYAFGGPVKVVYQIARELVKRKHDVVVYTSDAKDLGSRLSIDPVRVIDGIKVQYMRNISQTLVKKSKLFITPQLIPSVIREVRKFDMIHLHEYRASQNIVVHHYAKKYGVPYVLQAHGSLPRIVAKQRLKWIYDVFFGYRLLRDASKVIALSWMEAERYRGMGVPEEKIAIIPNGIDLSKYSNLPPKGSFKKKFSISDDEKMVLYLGRIHESKGLDLLAEAFSIVEKKLKNVRLVVVGPDDGYASAFSKSVSSLGIRGKVLLTGFVEKEDKLAALVDSDVFATPRFYGFPITFLEACVAERPIVTTKRGDELDLIANGAGLVVEYSPQNFAEALIYLLTTVNIAERMGLDAKRLLLNEFTLQKVVNKLEKVYETIAKSSG